MLARSRCARDSFLLRYIVSCVHVSVYIYMCVRARARARVCVCASLTFCLCPLCTYLYKHTCTFTHCRCNKHVTNTRRVAPPPDSPLLPNSDEPRVAKGKGSEGETGVFFIQKFCRESEIGDERNRARRDKPTADRGVSEDPGGSRRMLRAACGDCADAFG